MEPSTPQFLSLMAIIALVIYFEAVRNDRKAAVWVAVGGIVGWVIARVVF